MHILNHYELLYTSTKQRIRAGSDRKWLVGMKKNFLQDKGMVVGGRVTKNCIKIRYLMPKEGNKIL